MSDPYLILGWVLLAALAFVYVGAVVELWSMWWRGQRRNPVVGWKAAVAIVLALVWPFALGCALMRWIEERA